MCTVKELIEKLQELPEDVDIFVMNDSRYELMDLGDAYHFDYLGDRVEIGF